MSVSAESIVVKSESSLIWLVIRIICHPGLLVWVDWIDFFRSCFVRIGSFVRIYLCLIILLSFGRSFAFRSCLLLCSLLDPGLVFASTYPSIFSFPFHFLAHNYVLSLWLHRLCLFSSSNRADLQLSFHYCSFDSFLLFVIVPSCSLC